MVGAEPRDGARGDGRVSFSFAVGPGAVGRGLCPRRPQLADGPRLTRTSASAPRTSRRSLPEVRLLERSPATTPRTSTPGAFRTEDDVDVYAAFARPHPQLQDPRAKAAAFDADERIREACLARRRGAARGADAGVLPRRSEAISAEDFRPDGEPRGTPPRAGRPADAGAPDGGRRADRRRRLDRGPRRSPHSIAYSFCVAIVCCRWQFPRNMRSASISGHCRRGPWWSGRRTVSELGDAESTTPTP